MPPDTTKGGYNMAMVKMAKTITRCFNACGKTYRIMQDENGNFWGFDKEILEKGGTVNGISGNIGRTLNETLRHCYEKARISELMKGKDADDTEIMKAALIASDEALKMFG